LTSRIVQLSLETDRSCLDIIFWVKGENDSLEELEREVMVDFELLLKSVETSGRGVYVQASTLGSLEALLSFLKDMQVPVCAVNIGTVHKKDVMRASVMLEHEKTFAVILAFDVEVEKDAQKMADESGVKIFTADIIYHLFDQFKDYMGKIKAEKQKSASEEAVFPCILTIFPEYVFNKKEPIILGIEVVEGVLKMNTPLCVIAREDMSIIELGRVTSMEINHKPVTSANRGSQVAIKIESKTGDHKTFGRQFDERDRLFSRITRRSIDALKECFRYDLNQELLKLLVAMKKIFDIQ